MHPLKGLFSTTTWVSRTRKVKPIWILTKQEMTGRQWYQLDHIQIICTLVQQTSGYATWFTAEGAIRIAHYDVITRKL